MRRLLALVLLPLWLPLLFLAALLAVRRAPWAKR